MPRTSEAAESPRASAGLGAEPSAGGGGGIMLLGSNEEAGNVAVELLDAEAVGARDSKAAVGAVASGSTFGPGATSSGGGGGDSDGGGGASLGGGTLGACCRCSSGRLGTGGGHCGGS
mmetsp:Transcript_119433/g.385607  ORF Transcript_119433/g.385607 Transcript_119433/m.385607 type:complete len:118 (-) Transcript_119433:2-355(-)